jgi:hypothetical protein
MNTNQRLNQIEDRIYTIEDTEQHRRLDMEEEAELYSLECEKRDLLSKIRNGLT